MIAIHALLSGDAAATLGGLDLHRLVVTNSVPAPEDSGLDLEVVGIGPLLADAIRRLEAGRRLDELESFQ